MNLSKEKAIGSTVYSWKSIVMGPFMHQNTVSMTFFTEHLKLFLNQRVSVFPVHRLSFWLRLTCGKPIFSSFVNIYKSKICLSVHITNSSVNFTWFVLLSHQNLDERSVFKPGPLFDLPQFWIVSKHFWFNSISTLGYSMPNPVNLVSWD